VSLLTDGSQTRNTYAKNKTLAKIKSNRALFLLPEYDPTIERQRLFHEHVILKLRPQIKSLIGIDPGAIIKLDCVRLIIGRQQKSGKGSNQLPEYTYGQRMRYTAKEDVF
jgi:hypothetical protein